MARPQATEAYIRFRADLSRQEAAAFVERELKCPQCGYLIGYAFSDATGHFKTKCQKCKAVSVMNFAYFCRRRRRGTLRRYTRSYREEQEQNNRIS